MALAERALERKCHRGSPTFIDRTVVLVTYRSKAAESFASITLNLLDGHEKIDPDREALSE